MNLGDAGRLVRRNTKEHSSLIMSVAAGVGVLSTVYLTNRAAFTAARIIDEDEARGGISDDRQRRLMERTKLVWKLYIPPALSAASTVTFIICANRVELKKTLAAQTAFAVSERVYSEYRDKVVEEYGERKDQAIRDSIAEDRVKAKPPEIIIAGSGGVLCCEMYTMRYFDCDMETLKKAQNDLNRRLLSNDYATLDDFYNDIGLAQTSTSGRLGWKSDKLMELNFTSLIANHGQPCLAFDYNYITAL